MIDKLMASSSGMRGPGGQSDETMDAARTGLFKRPTLDDLAPPQRMAALDLLKALLTEVTFVAEAGRGGMTDQEAGDDQDHA